MGIEGERAGLVRMDHTSLEQVRPLPIPDGYEVRSYRREDWDACVELMLATPDIHYKAGPWNRELCERSLAFVADEHYDYPDGRGQIAWRGDEAVAMALAGGMGYLNQVYTRPEHQRRGLAGAVTSRVLVALHRAGLARSFLMVYAGNAGAIRCYEKMGFQRVWSGSGENLE